MNSQEKRVPDFIGIGAPKAGTTWLATCLKEHPDIYMPDHKEVVYFSSNARLERGLDWYLAHFDNADNDQTVGEFSVAYLSRGRTVAQRIYEMNSDAKVIAVLRDPVDRAYSHYRWLQQIGRLDTSVGFMDALKMRHELVADSSYGKSIAGYFEIFDPSNVLMVPYEMIAKDPMKLLNQVYRFLSVSEGYVPKKVATRVSVTISPKSRTLEQFRISIYRYARRKNQYWLIDSVKRFGISQLYRMLNRKPDRMRISETDYKAAAGYFTDDLILLNSISAFDISGWSLSSMVDIC